MKAIPSHYLYIALACSALTLSACSESVESEDVRTSGIYAVFQVYGDSDSRSATARADLRVGGANSNTHLDLTGGERLVVTAGGISRTMSRKESDPGNIYYETAFDNLSGATEFTFSFERSEFADAPNSTVTLPMVFSEMNISKTSGSADFTYVRSSDDLSIDWIGEDPATVTATGGCINKHDTGADVSSPHAIPRNTLAEAKTPPEPCNITFHVNKAATGTLDSAFGDGRVEASQDISRQIYSTP